MELDHSWSQMPHATGEIGYFSRLEGRLGLEHIHNWIWLSGYSLNVGLSLKAFNFKSTGQADSHRPHIRQLSVCAA